MKSKAQRVACISSSSSTEDSRQPQNINVRANRNDVGVSNSSFAATWRFAVGDRGVLEVVTSRGANDDD